VQMISASGTPEECVAKVREYVEAGCTCPILYPLGDDVRAMIEAFSPSATASVTQRRTG
jgi:5,10-methylenetetrahydromethanopterin reductase